MTEPDLPPQPPAARRPEPQTPPLEYASPREEQLGAGRMVFQAVQGCAITCGAIMGAVFFGLLYGITGSGSTMYATIAIAAGIALVAGAVTLAVRVRRHPKRRGWAMGIWFGIGLAGLLEGICFSGMMF
jgi:hypothetical protein